MRLFVKEWGLVGGHEPPEAKPMKYNTERVLNISSFKLLTNTDVAAVAIAVGARSEASSIGEQQSSGAFGTL